MAFKQTSKEKICCRLFYWGLAIVLEAWFSSFSNA